MPVPRSRNRGIHSAGWGLIIWKPSRVALDQTHQSSATSSLAVSRFPSRSCFTRHRSPAVRQHRQCEVVVLARLQHGTADQCILHHCGHDLNVYCLVNEIFETFLPLEGRGECTLAYIGRVHQSNNSGRAIQVRGAQPAGWCGGYEKSGRLCSSKLSAQQQHGRAAAGGHPPDHHHGTAEAPGATRSRRVWKALLSLENL